MNVVIICLFRDKEILKELLSFSGWSLFGNISVIGANQGVAMVMNIFLGVMVNTSIGIANQVNAAVYGFVSNFQMAFGPQITKSYASNDIENHKKLIFQASKFSFYLCMIFAIPILLNTEYILTLWLKTTPSFAVQFTQLTIVVSLLQALSGPFWMSANAIGNIRNYQISLSLIIILNLPCSYIILYYGYSPVYVYLVNLFISLGAYIFRFFYVKAKLRFSFFLFFNKVFLKIIVVCFVTSSILYYLNEIFLSMDKSIFNFLIFNVMYIFVALLVIVCIGISRSEKNIIYNIIQSKFFK